MTGYVAGHLAILEASWVHGGYVAGNFCFQLIFIFN